MRIKKKSLPRGSRRWHGGEGGEPAVGGEEGSQVGGGGGRRGGVLMMNVLVEERAQPAQGEEDRSIFGLVGGWLRGKLKEDKKK